MEKGSRTWRYFRVPGCGSVSCDIADPRAVPVVFFEDGRKCDGLPRSMAETASMGYVNPVEANFDHEAIHLFLPHRLGFCSRSVQHAAAAGANFEAEVLADAMYEERLVLGFQIAFRRVEEEESVGGFLLHLNCGARRHAEEEIGRQFGLPMGRLVDEFREIMDRLNQGAIAGTMPTRVDAGDLFGDAEWIH